MLFQKVEVMTNALTYLQYLTSVCLWNTVKPFIRLFLTYPSNTNSRPKATKKRFDYAFALPSSHLRPEVGIKSPERHEDEQNATKGRPIYECALWSPFDRHMFAFLLPGHPVGEQKTQHFFCSPYRCPGNHFTNGIRILSTFATHSFFCSFFVRIKSAMATEWRMKYEQFSISS